MSDIDKKDKLDPKKSPIEENSLEEVTAAEEAPIEEASVEEVTATEREAPVEEAPIKEVAVEEETPAVETSIDQVNIVADKAPIESDNSKENLDPLNGSDDSVDLPFMIGIKLGMTQIFSDDGTSYPVTVVQAGPCTITQIKSDRIDGYNSIQLGFSDKKENKTNKSLLGHFKKSNTSPKKYLKEFRTNKVVEDLELGSTVKLNAFNVGDMLTITGYSKGRGFAGHMKRHNFSGGRASHGKNSVMRKAGSVGAGTSPGKVWKGTRMAGRMGNDKVTIKNLELVKVDSNDNLLFVSGSIPGANNKIVYINK